MEPNVWIEVASASARSGLALLETIVAAQRETPNDGRRRLSSQTVVFLMSVVSTAFHDAMEYARKIESPALHSFEQAWWHCKMYDPYGDEGGPLSLECMETVRRSTKEGISLLHHPSGCHIGFQNPDMEARALVSLHEMWAQAVTLSARAGLAAIDAALFCPMEPTTDAKGHPDELTQRRMLGRADTSFKDAMQQSSANWNWASANAFYDARDRVVKLGEYLMKSGTPIQEADLEKIKAHAQVGLKALEH